LTIETIVDKVKEYCMKENINLSVLFRKLDDIAESGFIKKK
jgi:hypothetical protein